MIHAQGTGTKPDATTAEGGRHAAIEETEVTS
jgi:hypothetical protein